MCSKSTNDRHDPSQPSVLFFDGLPSEMIVETHAPIPRPPQGVTNFRYERNASPICS